jgi:hypothetical protein
MHVNYFLFKEEVQKIYRSFILKHIFKKLLLKIKIDLKKVTLPKKNGEYQ